jgi:hypothetical protein
MKSLEQSKEIFKVKSLVFSSSLNKEYFISLSCSDFSLYWLERRNEYSLVEPCLTAKSNAEGNCGKECNLESAPKSQSILTMS